MAKIVFMGSPAFAVPSLRALHAAGHEIVAVYSQPPRPAGRGQQLQKTAVHEAAEELGLAVFTPEKLRGADLDFVLGLAAEVFCVVAYGLLLPKALVDNRVCLNVHPSALPKWRGAAPLQWTLIAGDTTTDVCVMRLDAGMDTGPVVMRETLGVPQDWNAAKLGHVTAEIGARMLVEVLAKNDFAGVPQVGEASHAVKITKEMRPIQWQRSAVEVFNWVRGLNPSPNATARLGEEVFKVYRTEVINAQGQPGEVLAADQSGVVVACGTGAVRILLLRRAGDKAEIKTQDTLRNWAEMKVGVKLS